MIENILHALVVTENSQKAPEKAIYMTPHTQYIIGIGKDHHATLTLDDEALKELLERTKCSFDFGFASIAMQSGHKISNPDWHDKDMFAYFVPASKYPANRNKNGTMLGLYPDDLVPYKAYFALKTKEGIAIFNPCASEILRTDWFIVE